MPPGWFHLLSTKYLEENYIDTKGQAGLSRQRQHLGHKSEPRERGGGAGAGAAAHQKNLLGWTRPGPSRLAAFQVAGNTKKKGGEREEERTSPYPTCFSPNMGCSCSSSSAHLATWGSGEMDSAIRTRDPQPLLVCSIRIMYIFYIIRTKSSVHCHKRCFLRASALIDASWLRRCFWGHFRLHSAMESWSLSHLDTVISCDSKLHGRWYVTLLNRIKMMGRANDHILKQPKVQSVTSGLVLIFVKA